MCCVLVVRLRGRCLVVGFFFFFITNFFFCFLCMQRIAPRPWLCVGLVMAWSREVLANPYIAAICNSLPPPIKHQHKDGS
jgi:hypothetical protein